MNRHQTAGADTHPFAPHGVQAMFGQRLQPVQLFEKAVPAAGIQILEQLLQKQLICCPADKIATATQHQRLIDRLLEAIMPLFNVAVFICLSGVGFLAIDPVMPQHRFVCSRELPPVSQVIHRGAQPVGAMLARHATQLPQRILQTFAQAFELSFRAS
jgi:hypothetical protein